MSKRLRIQERVRWSDVDASGWIRWDAYTRLVEAAETELFREAGFPYATVWESLGIWLPRVQFHLDLRSPARLDDMLDAEICVKRIGRSSIHLEFLLQKNGETAAEGHLVIVAVSRQTGESIDVPEPLARALTG